MRNHVEFLPNMNQDVVENVKGLRLCAYLIAIEGWRRGLKLTWYKDGPNQYMFTKLKKSIAGMSFSLSDNQETHFFHRSRGDKVNNSAVSICSNKEETKSHLSKHGVQVPLGSVLTEDKSIISYAEEIGFPVIIKPLKGSMGKGVYTNINSSEQLQDVLKELRSKYKYKKYIVEKHYYGKEYRVYVVGDQVVAATYRVPANVIGDGISTVEQLIEIKNEQRKSNPYLKSKPIKVDYEIEYLLRKEGYNLQSILEKGKQVFLREKSNLSSGGDPLEATDKLTKEVKKLAVDAVKAIPMIPHAGVDVIVDPEDHRKGVVLEINSTAEIGFHYFPLEGKAKDIGKAIIDYYFPHTVQNKKSTFYFDYYSVLDSLKSGAVDDLTIGEAPRNNLIIRKYTVIGKVRNVAYPMYIKKEALGKGLMGTVQIVNRNTAVIYIVSNEINKLNDFMKLVKKGTKESVIESVTEETLSNLDKPMKTGFHIITNMKSKK